jgi:hypothetical protein
VEIDVVAGNAGLRELAEGLRQSIPVALGRRLHDPTRAAPQGVLEDEEPLGEQPVELVAAQRSGDLGLVEDLAAHPGDAVVVEYDHARDERGQLLRVPAHLARDDRPHGRRDPLRRCQLRTTANRVRGAQDERDRDGTPEHRRGGDN